MDAAEAERCGLVSRVVPAKALMEEAMKAAQKVVEKSMLTAMVVKECVNRAQEVALSEGLLFERRMFHASSRPKTRKRAWPHSWKSASRSSATAERLLVRLRLLVVGEE
jgi:enoyl-CoA hydratase